VGYTNAGKSTLFNALTKAGTYAADQLFATLDTTSRKVHLEGVGRIVVSDTVGFIRDLPHQLVEAFRATLDETIHADLILHVIDACSPVAREQKAEVEAVLEEIGADEIPRIEIMNKIDHNNSVQKKMEQLQQQVEDKMGTNKEDAASRSDKSSTKKDRKDERKEEQNYEIRSLNQQLDTLRSQILPVNLDNVYVPNTPTHQQFWTNTVHGNAFAPNISDTVVKEIMELDVENNMKILLLLGIGMFTNRPHAGYMEVMKRLAYEQKLYLILASSDYIYGTNYAFCHGFIGKDLTNMTQQKIIQAMGRVGRNKIQQEYTVRFRDDEIMMKLFLPQKENLEAVNMNKLFSHTAL
jgi:GTP-binding protein EngB required for normal cell division